MYSLLLRKLILPLGSLFFNGNYSRYLKNWKDADALSAADLHKIQQKKLIAILSEAINHVPFYKKLSALNPNDLLSFPILTKSILRKDVKDLISLKYDIDSLEMNHSSGSSGVQSFTFMSSDHKFYLRALQTHWWMWGGYKPGEPLLQTGMSPKRRFPKNLKDLFFRVVYLEAFRLTRYNILAGIKDVRNRKTKHIAGYPSSINEIAKILIKDNQKHSFNSVILFGDKLFDHHIRNFEIAFKYPTLVVTYGCAEGLLIGCKIDLPYYYIMSPHVIVEIVNEKNEPVADGEMGHILVTCLTNTAMPIIRYKLGDLGIMLPKEKYPKNRRFNYPLLQKVVGRETDVIETPDGAVLIVHSFTGIFEFYTEIKQYKIIQSKPNQIIVEYLLDLEELLSEKRLEALQRQLDELVNSSMDIVFKKVDFIAPSPSGKPQIIEIAK